MPAKKPKPDEKPQFERFLDTVKLVKADETDEEIEKAFTKAVPKVSDQKSQSAKTDQ